MAYPIKSVYLFQTTKTSFHTFIRVWKEFFQIIQKLLRTSGSQPDCSTSADPQLRWNAGRDNRLCQSCEEGLPPQSIVAAAFCLHSSRAIMIGSPPMKNTWLGSRFRPRRALHYRLPNDMPDRHLEITFPPLLSSKPWQNRCFAVR